MEDYSSCEDLDDDWFFESVTRYNTLQMFYLQNITEHALQIDELTLVLACRSQKCRVVELLELRIPAKLTMPVEDEGRSKENDFKMLSGIYIDQPVHQMGALREEQKIITSQERKKGFQIYSFHSNSESDAKQEFQVFASRDWSTPNFIVQQEEKRIVSSTCIHNPLTICDINSEEVIKELKYPFYNTLSNCFVANKDASSCLHSLKCELLDRNTLSVLNTKTGVIALIDLRTGNTFSILGTTGNKDCDELWTISDSDFKTSSSYFGTLSTKGNLSLYDLRNNNKILKYECFSSLVNNFKLLKLKKANRERFSISGVDSNIYVYNILKNDCILAFTHNGHCQKNVSNDVNNLINDHIWLPSIGNNFLVSVSNNRSLNCWEYNESVR